MSEHYSVTYFRRVVAALPADGDAAPLARLAAQLAGICQAELAALMVEDATMADLARLPAVRHVALSSGIAVPFTPDVLRLSLAAAANRLQNQIADHLRASALQWSLQAGPSPDTLPGIDESDLLMLSARIALPSTWNRSPPPLKAAVAALVIDAARAGHSILVVFDGSPAARRALAIASHLAAAGHGRCTVLVDADSARSSGAEIAEAFERDGATFAIAPVPRLDAETVAAQVPRLQAALVLLPAESESVWRLQAILGNMPAGGA